MILSGQTIRKIRPVEPFFERTVRNGMSYGLSSAGYDIRCDQDLVLYSRDFVLASSVEYFDMPSNVLGIVHDKSTWARRGVTVQNTIIEPGWKGHLTLEIANHSRRLVCVMKGDPIAQIVFHFTDEDVEAPYTGKYQNQGSAPQEALEEVV